MRRENNKRRGDINKRGKLLPLRVFIHTWESQTRNMRI